MKKYWKILYLDMWGDPLVTLYPFSRMTFDQATIYADDHYPLDRYVEDYKIVEDETNN